MYKMKNKIIDFLIRFIISLFWLLCSYFYITNNTDNFGYGIPAMFIGGSILIWFIYRK